MNAPLTPPTDNLYKFVAVSGVVLFVVAVVLGLRRYEEYDRLLWEAMPVVDSARDAAIRSLDAVIERAEAREQAGPGTGRLRRRITEAELARIEAEAKRTSEAAKVIRARLYAAERRYDAGRIYALVLGLLGLLVAVAGFFLWYWRLQKHQDKVIKKQASDR